MTGRVIMLGAGASIYCAFPLASRLWNFVIGHLDLTRDNEPERAVGWLESLLLDVRPQLRLELMSDLESLLTIFDQADVFTSHEFATAFAIDSARQRGDDSGSYMTSQAVKAVTARYTRRLRSHYGHMSARQNGFPYFFGRQVALQNPHGARYREVRLGILDALRKAFIMHEECLRPALGPLHRNEYYVEESMACPCLSPGRLQSAREVDDVICKVISPGDTIVTFNWDVHLESVLFNAELWSPIGGYGLRVHWDAAQVPIIKTLQQDSAVTILKLHGSANWAFPALDPNDPWRQDYSAFGAEDGVFLRHLNSVFHLPVYSTYTSRTDKALEGFHPVPGQSRTRPEYPEEAIAFAGDMDADFHAATIMNPTYIKDYDLFPVANHLWDRAYDAILNAQELIVCGYSLPAGDADTEAKLREAISARHHPLRIRYLGKDTAALRRWQQLGYSVGADVIHEPIFWEHWVRLQSQSLNAR